MSPLFCGPVDALEDAERPPPPVNDVSAPTLAASDDENERQRNRDRNADRNHDGLSQNIA